MPYVITIDNPYYPQVHYRETRILAEELAGDLKMEMGEKDGQYEAKIVIGTIIKETPVKTHH